MMKYTVNGRKGVWATSDYSVQELLGHPFDCVCSSSHVVEWLTWPVSLLAPRRPCSDCPSHPRSGWCIPTTPSMRVL